MVVTDPKTGNILGLVGGRGTKSISRGFNIATMAKRSPGSSIKPLTVYAPALDAGLITYGTIVDDTPFMFNEKTDTAGNVKYTAYPANLPAVYKGLTTVNSAVERSVNTIAMKVLDMISIDKSFDFLKNELHIDSLIDSYTKANGEVLTDRGYAALSLGQPNYGITVEEITARYAFPTCRLHFKEFYRPILALYKKPPLGFIRKHLTANSGIADDFLLVRQYRALRAVEVDFLPHKQGICNGGGIHPSNQVDNLLFRLRKIHKCVLFINFTHDVHTVFPLRGECVLSALQKTERLNNELCSEKRESIRQLPIRLRGRYRRFFDEQYVSAI
jgi:hypothetical protein